MVMKMHCCVCLGVFGNIYILKVRLLLNGHQNTCNTGNGSWEFRIENTIVTSSHIKVHMRCALSTVSKKNS
jgi:hypothetical protein